MSYLNKNSRIYFGSYALSALALILFMTSMKPGNQDVWQAPAESKLLLNPLSGDAKSLSDGMKLYNQQCWSCHGKTGAGDGPAARALKSNPANFRSDAFQDQADGEIFWKISEGRGEMAGYKNSLKEINRWQLVNYLKSLN